jgi:thiamine biosynthesis lipoprotein
LDIFPDAAMMELVRKQGYFAGRFAAMASPCEVLMDVDDERLASALLKQAAEEAARIEAKFSRYRDDSIIHAIHSAAGTPVRVDEETARLLDYAAHCYRISGGLFDVTSGVLRRAWRFDGSDRVPSQQQIAALLPLIGWDKVRWENPEITLPAGMEIDLGGIGKEYAADRVALLLHNMLRERGVTAGLLANFGGDISVTGPQRSGAGWTIGVEGGATTFQLARGGVATSGDTRRFLLKDGVRYSHILDPRTGWPVQGSPSTVTVVANTCTDAGILSTLALLHGAEAEAFLRAQNVRFWCQW